MAKSRSYYKQTRELTRELQDSLGHDVVKALHAKSPARHFAIVVRQFALLFASAFVLWQYANPLIWIPVALLMGFTMFNFTVLLHEQVHSAIFVGNHPRAMRFLGLLYAFPSGISASQFTRWHLDHHDNLGSSTEDPKRFYLSPKRNARWFKLLYCTPGLFPIYFRAARQEMQSYPAALQRTISLERNVTILLHVSILALIWWAAGFQVAARVYLVPYFLVFPIAFTLNRLGQHYFIDPTDPAKWSCRVDGNAFWHFIFLYSNFHLEHHYYQSVPFYRLKELNQALRPFFAQRGVKNRGYADILWKWYGLNRAPHTDWDRQPAAPEAITPSN
jgi:fatty acid desaturase